MTDDTLVARLKSKRIIPYEVRVEAAAEITRLTEEVARLKDELRGYGMEFLEDGQ